MNRFLVHNLPPRHHPHAPAKLGVGRGLRRDGLDGRGRQPLDFVGRVAVRLARVQKLPVAATVGGRGREARLALRRPGRGEGVGSRRAGQEVAPCMQKLNLSWFIESMARE